MKSTGRNEPCPCGSGTKYKHCCERKDSQPFMSKMGLGLGIAIAIVLAGGVAALFNDQSNDAETGRRLKDVLQGRSQAPVSSSAEPPASAAAPLTPGPQPPGPVPAGKTWSAEHGHWHDTPIKIEATRQGGLTASTSPEPPQKGGLEWNEEHGHYHRVNPAPAPDPSATGPHLSFGPDGQARVNPGASAGPVRANPGASAPPGPAPEGQIWSAEHGHWHDAPAGASTQPETSTSQDPQ